MKTDRVMTNVGVIGAGRMGTPIIGHLVRKGFATQVFDLDAAKAGAVKGLGAKWAASSETLAGIDVEHSHIEAILREVPDHGLPHPSCPDHSDSHHLAPRAL